MNIEVIRIILLWNKTWKQFTWLEKEMMYLDDL